MNLPRRLLIHLTLVPLLGPTLAAGMAWAGFNEDGRPDLVFANRNIQDRVCLAKIAGYACKNLSAEVDPSNDVATGDFDGNGHLDVVLAINGDSNRICLGDGSGGFSCDDVSTATGLSWAVAVGHFNADANLDVVFANVSERNRVCFGNGSGGFSSCSDVSYHTANSYAVALAEGNGVFPIVPAVSGWGLVLVVALLLTAGTVAFTSRSYAGRERR